MLPFLNFGPFAIPSKPMTMILGFYLALFLLERHVRRLKEDDQLYYTIGTNSLIIAFIGARMIFVADNWAAYRDNLVSVVWPITVGYHVLGGTLLFFAALFYFSRRHQISLGSLFDRFVPFFLAALFAFILGDMLGGPGFGRSTTLLGLTSHPVWLYEFSVVGLASLTFLWIRDKKLVHGSVFLIIAAIVATGFLITSPFRGNSPLLLGQFNQWQLLSLLVMSGSLAILAFGKRNGASNQIGEIQ